MSAIEFAERELERLVKERTTKPYKKPRKPGDAGFYRGVIAALGALRGMCGAASTEYHEVVKTFDLGELLHSARRGGDMRWSGLSEYLRFHKDGRNGVKLDCVHAQGSSK